MVTYILRRLALSVPLLLVVSLLTFVLVAFIPGDPAVRILGAGHTAAEYHKLDRQLGLTEPVLTQYWHWLDHALHGSLGTSLFSLQSVASEVNQRVGVTASLVIGATLVSLFVGVLVGTISAVRAGFLGRLIDSVSWLGFAMPNFWLGLLLVEYLATKLKVLPPSGYVSPGQSWTHWLQSLVLPVLTLSAAGVTGIAKQTRDALSEVMTSEYIAALRLAGVPWWRILLRHALRNAAIPIVTTLGLFMVAMLGGTILVEQVFLMPGMGSLAVQAAGDHDLPVIEGVVIYFTLIVVVINVFVDLSYAWLNPRVRVAR